MGISRFVCFAAEDGGVTCRCGCDLVHHDTDPYDLTVKTPHGAAVIEATTTHLFWDQARHQWVDAAELHRGDRMHTSDGTTVTVIVGRH